jgi:hypothetical protein
VQKRRKQTVDRWRSYFNTAYFFKNMLYKIKSIEQQFIFESVSDLTLVAALKMFSSTYGLHEKKTYGDRGPTRISNVQSLVPIEQRSPAKETKITFFFKESKLSRLPRFCERFKIF